MRRASLTIMLLLTLSAITFYNPTTHQNPVIAKPSHVKSQSMTSTAIVSIIPENVSDLARVPGSTVVFNVTLADSPWISAFDVWVKFDPNVLGASSSSIDYSGNILGPGAVVQSECINDQAIFGLCQPYPLGGTGVVNLGLFDLGNKTTSVPAGLLYRLTLTVLKVGFSQLHLLEVVLVNGAKNESYQSTNVDGLFTNEYCGSRFCTAPFVDFTFTPNPPSVDSVIMFNASASKATNGNARIVAYTWFWDEICRAVGTIQNVTVPTVSHVFCNAEVHQVTLTVTDSFGISWSVTRMVQVVYLFIDVGIASLTVAPSTSVPVGTHVNIIAVVDNNSTIVEAANTTIRVGNQQIATNTFVNMSPRSQQTLAGIWDTTGFTPGTYTIEASVAPIPGANITSDDVKAVSVQLFQSSDKAPVAKFTFSPTNPRVGENVFFDGSASYDPDGIVQLWTWDFGDNNGVSTTPTPVRGIAFLQPANYTVTLTVTDNAGLTATTSSQITIRPVPPHDVSIVSAIAEPKTVVSTQNVNIQVVLRNDGFENETVTLTVLDDNHVIRSKSGILLEACLPNASNVFCNNQYYANINWDTTGVAAGNYTISATVSISPGETDPTPSDNNLTGGRITILPPPMIDLAPNSGVVGTKVQVTGSGFPAIQQNPFGSAGPIFVTFDNMFLGYSSNANNGSFTFTFDVLESEPGMHQVIAFDVNTGAHASTMFTVLSAPTGRLSVTVDTGSVYFPGDTAVMYILTTFNGFPVEPSNVQLQVSLYWPNGTAISLHPTSIAKGIYKVTLAIPRAGPLGTYFVLIKAHESTPSDASALVSFEVRLPWLSSNSGRITVGATAFAGVVGLVAVAWRKGYVRRKNE